MCGIFCSLFFNESSSNTLINEYKLFEKSLKRRGPNFQSYECLHLKTCNILIAASVLWLQGKQLTKQPVHSQNSILIYNGDVFGGLASDSLREEIGDTTLFLQILPDHAEQAEGPFAFIYLDIARNAICFGRDAYGRRSLLLGQHKDRIILTSVAGRHTEYKFIELPPIGVFYISLDTKSWKLVPWRRKNGNFREKLEMVETFLGTNIQVLNDGNADSSGLINFDPPHSKALDFINNVVNQPHEEIFDFLKSEIWSDNISNLNSLLTNSIRKRVSTLPQYCMNCLKESYPCRHALLGVLFSGGVDCAVLARLAAQFSQDRPIDLINVAFEKNDSYETPDRITGAATLQELQKLCPDTEWNFIEINISQEELDFCRSHRIADLIYPLNSVLDDSLGCALWFAGRGATADYTSPCRILLVGMGADELFGGYTKHRAAFKKGGWLALHDILNIDWENLPHRNLARDDRVISDHGRQLRTPYLDEKVVEFVRGLPMWKKCIPLLPHGFGEKILLRCLAHQLGLYGAASFKKRALQFGSRIANPKENAHEVSQRL